MINKRIFYLWCGSSKPIDVEACVLSWRLNLPDYEIVEIKEDDAEWFDFKQACRENGFFNYVYKNKIWAYVADYIRFYVLEKFGGIWLDTDVQVLKSFNDLLDCGLFVGQENPKYVESAVIGAEAHHPLIKQALDFYNNEIWNSSLYTSPRILTHVLKEFGCLFGENGISGKEDVKIYSPEYFYPLPFNASFTPDLLTDKSHALHWWKTSWSRPDVLNWLKNKHKYGKNKALQVNLEPYLRLYLFGFLPIGRYYVNIKQVSLFGLPFMKIKTRKTKTKAMLFGFLPLLKWK